jgi:hypothetical protein
LNPKAAEILQRTLDMVRKRKIRGIVQTICGRVAAGSVAALLLAGCGGGKVVDDAKMWQPYIPPDRAFTVKAPKPPEIRGYGNAPKQYTFYGMDMKAGGPLLTVRTAELPPEGAVGVPPTITPGQYEAGYRAESGAVVDGKDITNGVYKGREIDITAGQRAPLVIRIFQVNGHQYWLEWNPTIAHATDMANTFTIP